jgi:uncharacterized membrane protein YidH (DUF202 family)
MPSEGSEPGNQSALRATDALANERTYLAYVRTALAFIGFGFVIARFSLFTREFAAFAHTTRERPRFRWVSGPEWRFAASSSHC